MKCTFKIKRVLTNKKDSKNMYRIFKASVSNVKFEEGDTHRVAVQKEMIIKGNMISCVEGDTYNATCSINVDPRWGVNLVLQEVEIQKYETEDELVKFFAKKVQGCGPKIAQAIVDKLGVDAIKKITSKDGEKILRKANIRGLGPKKIVEIRESVLFHENFADIVMFLQMNNLDVKMANVLYEEFGKGCLLDLKENPYVFAGYVDFKKIDDAGLKAGFKNIDMDRIKAGIKGYVQMKLDTKGDVYVPVEEIQENLAEYMNNKSLFEPITVDLSVMIKEALIELNYDGNKAYKTSKCNLIVDDMKRVYRRDMYYLETRIANRLKAINSNDEDYDFDTIDTIIDLEEAKQGIKLASKQREAVHMAMKNNFFVLCGLPGTGKTSTTNMILRVYRRYCDAFGKPNTTLLMAPTGKASRRLTELCNEPAMTIHRALGIKLFEQADLSEPIKANFLVIDESSMVDIYMFFTLLEKVKQGTKIMFVGDDEQLPSVGAGLILRDLINAQEIQSVKLTEIFRQASTSNIVHNSHQIVKGQQDFMFKDDCFLTEVNSDYTKVHRTVIAHYKRMLEKGYTKEEICILTPTRKGMFGTEALNKLIQSLNPNTDSIRANGYDMKIGDMVMQNTNNYDLDVFNGEVGEIIDFKTNPNNKKLATITVKYPDKIVDELTGEEFDKIVVYSNEEFSELELAYAITIHKSQGSEYKAVICMCMQEHSLMLSKNLVYTGFTRAKELLSIIGQKSALEASANKKTQISRRSYLVERLGGDL
ncbi:MAG: AAA family ATPase [Clostridium sp.]|nr:AAA family ATPase [Clostridium sp.]